MILFINIILLMGVFYCGFKIGQELQNKRISDLIMEFAENEINKTLDRKMDDDEKKEILNRLKKEVEKYENSIND